MEEFLINSQKLVHIDLKTCPLKVNYLKQLFKLFRSWQATGLLLEWEDTFPYDGMLADIGSVSSQLPYSSNEIREILDSAKINNLVVIPLVQTFGHLEFVLKTSTWQHVREVPRYCSSICPSHPDSIPLITAMIDQIMSVHKEILFLHIGGDEVWHLGLCDRCKSKNKQYLFMNHIMKILHFIREKYPHITAIMWDDMLRGIDENILRECNIGKFVEPMIWDYRPAETFSITSDLWEKYEKVFASIWIASAFKGATGSCQILPVIGQHLSNHDKWLNVVNELRCKLFKIRGITLTGWSRYDHYAVLCELMPAAISSLAVCLKSWLNGKFENNVYDEVSSLLGFTKETPLPLSPLNRQTSIPKCLNFPAYQIYIGIEWLANIRTKFHFVAYGDQSVTWFNPWHVKRNNTSLMQVEHIIVNFHRLLEELITIEKHFYTYMPEAFYDHTIEEWLGCYLHPMKEKMIELVNDAESQLKLLM